MITPGQKKWLDHLSDKNKIKIIPFDPTAEEKFQKVKQKIQKALGKNIPVEHHGATSLGISGQDEIDVYIPISAAKFNNLIESLKSLFGLPKSLYPKERARFVTEEESKHVDIFLINKRCKGWKSSLIFEKYLHSHPEALDEYRLLKENGNGLSTREYYRRKIEFINEILSRVENV